MEKLGSDTQQPLAGSRDRGVDSPGLADALRSVIPGLRRMLDQLGPRPVASAAALDRVATAARDSRSLTRRIVASPEMGGGLPAAPVSITPENSPVDDWTWEALESSVVTCTKCPHLAVTRKHAVFGAGSHDAHLLFVGDAPGAEEDASGEPFVGEAGVLFNKIITAMGMTRDQIFVTNAIKCRPDMPPGTMGNRKPRADEMATCNPWLTAQVHLIRPRAIIALGSTAVIALTGDQRPIARLRGQWLEFRGIPVMPTYPLVQLLSQQALGDKRKVWEDLLAVMERLEIPISEKQRKFFTK